MMRQFFVTTTAVLLNLVAGISIAENALAFSFTDKVPGSHNLYYEDWGHSFNVVGGGNEMFAIGGGEAPISFGDGLAFSSGQQIHIDAKDCVIDASLNCTDPNGYNSLFRGLPVYSLIGVWSSDAETISAVEPVNNAAFFIGSSQDLIVPDYTDSLYLFLATNDGNYSDNPSTYAYTITISGDESQSIPEPSLLVGLGCVSLLGLRSRRFCKE